MRAAADRAGLLLLKQEWVPPGVGGSRVYYYEILRRLGPGRSTVIAGLRAASDHEWDAQQPFRTLRRTYLLPSVAPGYIGLVDLHLRWLVDAARVAWATPGCVLGVGQADWSVLIGVLLRALLGVPYVVFVHGEELAKTERSATLASRLRRRVLRYALRRADGVITNARPTSARVEALGVPPGRISRISPGVDAQRFFPQPNKSSPASPPRLLTVARLIERKGVDVLLRSLVEVRRRHPGTELIVVGDGPERARLERLAVELDLAACTSFRGVVADADLPEVYRSADAFVLANRELGNADVEGFGVVFLEAAASGLPVVGGASGGTADAVADGVDGLLVDAASPRAVARAIETILDSSALWQAMRTAGRERVLRDHDWNRVAARVEAVLEGSNPSR